jgi:hypothetical protein
VNTFLEWAREILGVGLFILSLHIATELCPQAVSPYFRFHAGNFRILSNIIFHFLSIIVFWNSIIVFWTSIIEFLDFEYQNIGFRIEYLSLYFCLQRNAIITPVSVLDTMKENENIDDNTKFQNNLEGSCDFSYWIYVHLFIFGCLECSVLKKRKAKIKSLHTKQFQREYPIPVPSSTLIKISLHSLTLVQIQAAEYEIPFTCHLQLQTDVHNEIQLVTNISVPGRRGGKNKGQG